MREADLILSSDNFLDVVTLGKESKSKPWMLSLCVSWVSELFPKGISSVRDYESCFAGVEMKDENDVPGNNSYRYYCFW